MTPTRETIARAIIQGLQDQPGHESERPYIDSCGDYGNLSAVRVDGDCNLISAARAVLSALEAEGWRVVPCEPDEAMRVAGVEAMGTAERAAQARASSLLTPRNDFQRGADSGGIMACNSINLDAAYRAMLEAAPKVTE